MIRIAFFADTLTKNKDGAVRTIYNLVSRIPENQVEFLFYCGEEPCAEFPYKFEKIRSINLPVNKEYSMVWPGWEKNRLNKSLVDFRPDVIHITTPSPLGKFALQFAAKYKLPVISIYHTHFISYLKYYVWRIPGLAKIIEDIAVPSYRRFYNKCSLVYVPTDKMKEDLKALGLPGHNFRVWPRGIDSKIFNPNKNDIDAIRKLTGNQRVNILFSSRLVWEKNLLTLCKIYNEAGKRGLPWNFIIAGDGMARKELEKLMPQAVFTGHLGHEELSVLYASSDIFLFTSVTETFGNVVLEAMASGLPCIIANGGGSAGLIRDGHTGLLCDPGNPSDYLDKINQVLGSVTFRENLIKNALEYAGNFGWDNLISTYVDDVQRLSVIRPEVNTGSLPDPFVKLALQ